MSNLRSYKDFLIESYLQDRVTEIEIYLFRNDKQINKLTDRYTKIFNEIQKLLPEDKKNLLCKLEDTVNARYARESDLLAKRIYKEVSNIE